MHKNLEKPLVCPICNRKTYAVFRFVNMDVYVHLAYFSTGKRRPSQDYACSVKKG